MREVTLLIERARLERARDGALIETTALVNGCYLKFVQRESLTPIDPRGAAKG
jgi:hypothetical protein